MVTAASRGDNVSVRGSQQRSVDNDAEKWWYVRSRMPRASPEDFTMSDDERCSSINVQLTFDKADIVEMFTARDNQLYLWIDRGDFYCFGRVTGYRGPFVYVNHFSSPSPPAALFIYVSRYSRSINLVEPSRAGPARVHLQFFTINCVILQRVVLEDFSLIFFLLLFYYFAFLLPFITSYYYLHTVWIYERFKDENKRIIH